MNGPGSFPLINQDIERSNVLTLLDKSFKKANPDDYVHFVVKNHRSEILYTTKFIPEIERLRTTTKSAFLLDAKRVNGWTPLHVAAIVGNLSAVKRLLEFVESNPKDSNGRTPFDYCMMFGHTAMLPLFENKPKNVGSHYATEFFKSWKVELPIKKFNYKSYTHDFGNEIVELLFSKPNQFKAEYLTLKIKNISQNMEQIAKKEGFKLKHTTTNLLPRDHFMTDSKNGHTLLSYAKNAKVAQQRNYSYELTHNHIHTDYPLMTFNFMRDPDSETYLPVLEHEDTYRFDLKFFLFYFEGGNHFISSDVKNDSKLLIGKNLFLTALNQLILNDFFKKNEELTNKYFEKIFHSLNDSIIVETLEEMYSQGLLKQTTACPKGFLNQDEYVKSISMALIKAENAVIAFDSGSCRQEAINDNFYSPMKLSPEMINKSRKITAAYLAKKEVVKDVMAYSFSIPRNNLHFITQLDYHLDVFMHPGPFGSYFVQDYKMTRCLLDTIKNNATTLGLTDKDKEMLLRYHLTASKLENQLSEKQKKVNEELKQAGFIVIPTPGIFNDWFSGEDFRGKKFENVKNINFLNALTGWSSKNERMFWITGGITIGDRLGKVIMDSFQQFLKQYQPDIAVHYVGYDPKDPTDFSEIMKWSSEPAAKAGIHCMSVELQTKSRTV